MTDLSQLPAPRRPKWTLGLALFLSVVLVVLTILMLLWSREPDHFDPKSRAALANDNKPLVAGYTTSNTVVELVDVLLRKSGGYLSNDLLPPGSLLDNMPNFEFGVVTQLRDFSIVLRNDFSRSQTQSIEDKDLMEAQPLFASPNDRWLLPSTESQYGKARDFVAAYRDRLADANASDAQFYARADNLAVWLSVVEKKLGSLSQRLSNAVGHQRINTDLAGDPAASQSTPASSDAFVKTPWTKIDDNFYEARGQCYALIHLLKAIRVDFEEVLVRKNALVSLDQIVRELESTQESIFSPVILNGSGYGFFANHSLVIANYVARATRAIGDLRQLLMQG
jgi:hypothetical protein